jgi:hypothetical protein
MGSWVEGLERRVALARERIEELGRRIAELTGLLAAEQERLSRLEITRETMAAVVAGTGGGGAAGPGVGVLPVVYRDILEVSVDAGRQLRAKEIAVGLGLSLEAVKVEGLCSKLRRLVEPGVVERAGVGGVCSG